MNKFEFLTEEEEKIALSSVEICLPNMLILKEKKVWINNLECGFMILGEFEEFDGILYPTIKEKVIVHRELNKPLVFRDKRTAMKMLRMANKALRDYREKLVEDDWMKDCPFQINDKIVWDSHFGYEIGYFKGKGVSYNTYSVELVTGRVQEITSISVDEIKVYSNALIDELTFKYEYEKRFSAIF